MHVLSCFRITKLASRHVWELQYEQKQPHNQIAAVSFIPWKCHSSFLLCVFSIMCLSLTFFYIFSSKVLSHHFSVLNEVTFCKDKRSGLDTTTTAKTIRARLAHIVGCCSLHLWRFPSVSVVTVAGRFWLRVNRL